MGESQFATLLWRVYLLLDHRSFILLTKETNRSIKVKDPATGKRSIAHFYRDVEIYPRLDPSVLLLPASRPIQSTTSKCLFRGGPGKLQLTALLHRLHFVAGQRCYIQFRVLNETKKTVRSLTITLLRTTTVFEPRPHLNLGASDDVDADACETITMVKEVAESTLQMGDQGAKGHASAKGWWTGVTSGQSRAFEHYIVLPVSSQFSTRLRPRHQRSDYLTG
jgi:hypothetical protein